MGLIGQHYLDKKRDKMNPSENTKKGRLNYFEQGIYLSQ